MGSSGDSSTTTGGETRLTREQFKVLQDREQFAQEFVFPELEQFMSETDNFALDDSFEITKAEDLLRAPAAQIGQQFNFQQEQLQGNFAQRGLGGSGFEAGALAQLGSQRNAKLQGAATQAFMGQTASQNQRIDVQNQNRMIEFGQQSDALGQLMSLAPQPTQAAPVGTRTTTEGGGGMGQMIGSAIGGLAGLWVGGPAGMSAGMAVGGATGSAIGG
jgi:hypothetical protein